MNAIGIKIKELYNEYYIKHGHFPKYCECVAQFVNSKEETYIIAINADYNEKYDNEVRVVTLYNSVELCGGTHVKNVGDIRKFAIMSIESKGANIYRIEAVTNNKIDSVSFEKVYGNIPTTRLNGTITNE